MQSCSLVWWGWDDQFMSQNDVIIITFDHIIPNPRVLRWSWQVLLLFNTSYKMFERFLDFIHSRKNIGVVRDTRVVRLEAWTLNHLLSLYPKCSCYTAVYYSCPPTQRFKFKPHRCYQPPRIGMDWWLVALTEAPGLTTDLFYNQSLFFSSSFSTSIETCTCPHTLLFKPCRRELLTSDA